MTSSKLRGCMAEVLGISGRGTSPTMQDSLLKGEGEAGFKSNPRTAFLVIIVVIAFMSTGPSRRCHNAEWSMKAESFTKSLEGVCRTWPGSLRETVAIHNWFALMIARYESKVDVKPLWIRLKQRAVSTQHLEYKEPFQFWIVSVDRSCSERFQDHVLPKY